MSELSAEARALLEAARQEGAPTEADRARVERSLAQTLAAPSTSAPAPASGPRLPRVQTSGSSSVASAALKAVVVALLAAAGAVALVVYSAPKPARSVAPARLPLVHAPRVEPAPTVLVPLPGGAPQVVLQEQRPSLQPIPAVQAPRFRPVQQRSPVFAPLDLREPTAAVAPVPTAAISESPLAEELKLMSQAQLDLRSGDAAGALALLDEYLRSFPRGALREEQVAARVQALCLLGRVPEARAEAVQFLADHPQSAYAAKVRASCAGAP